MILRWLEAFVLLSLACPTMTPQSFYRTLPLALHLFSPVLRVQQPHTMSELWHQRLGHPGTTQLAHLQHHATGLPPPHQLHTHPLRACQVCHDARVRKQPAGHVQPATDIRPGSRFHLDFGFMRASSETYQRAKGKDRVVLSHDGYNAYCLITDACSRYTWCFNTTSKEPPVNILDMFLTRHGLQDKNTPRSIRVYQGGEFARSEEFRKLVSKHGYVVEPIYRLHHL